MEDFNNFFQKFFDQNQSDLRRYFRLGETDGKNEKPAADSINLSPVEAEILQDAEDSWKKFKSAHLELQQKIENDIEKTKLEIESEITVNLDKISDDKNLDLDLIETQYGTGTSEYKNLKSNL